MELVCMELVCMELVFMKAPIFSSQTSLDELLMFMDLPVSITNPAGIWSTPMKGVGT
jgi:hypothetical protein